MLENAAAERERWSVAMAGEYVIAIRATLHFRNMSCRAMFPSRPAADDTARHVIALPRGSDSEATHCTPRPRRRASAILPPASLLQA